MKNKKSIIALIVVLSIIAISIIGGLIYLLINGDKFNFNFSFGKKMNLVDSYEVAETNKIYLNLRSTDVEIKKSTNDKILVEYYSSNSKYAKIEDKDNSIEVNEDKYNLSCKGFCFANRKVVVYLTDTFNGDIEINTKSGDISSVKDLSSNKVKIKVTSGDVVLSKIGSANITAKSGDIKIDEVTKKINIEVRSGDVRIDKFNIIKNSSITARSGDVRIKNNISDCYVETKTSTGDSSVKKSNRKSDIVLTIKTSSGDIKVN